MGKFSHCSASHLEYANSSNTDVYLIVLMGRLNALISAKNRLTVGPGAQ